MKNNAKDLALYLAEKLEPIPEDHAETAFWQEIPESCGVFRSPLRLWEAQDDDMPDVDPWPATLNGPFAVAVIEAMTKREPKYIYEMWFYKGEHKLWFSRGSIKSHHDFVMAVCLAARSALRDEDFDERFKESRKENEQE